MGREVSQLVARSVVALAAAYALVLVDLGPLLGASPAAATDLVVLSLAALALAVGARCRVVASTPRAGAVCPLSSEPTPLLRGRATDPGHHPLAPRAPGPA